MYAFFYTLTLSIAFFCLGYFFRWLKMTAQDFASHGDVNQELEYLKKTQKVTGPDDSIKFVNVLTLAKLLKDYRIRYVR